MNIKLKLCNVENFLDSEGRIKVWPSKLKNKVLVLKYIFDFLDEKVSYSEEQINNHIKKYINFEDYVLVRREMYENDLLDRSLDGRMYWKKKDVIREE